MKRLQKTPPLSPRVTEEFPYSSIAKVKYFTEIEQICLDKSISTENLDQFFKAHWLRDKMGVFARAQEMLAAYKQYVDEVPEEARAIEIPDQIKDAFSDFTAFITLVLPLKLYGYPESDSVKIAKAEITQLRQRNAEILEELSQSKEQATVLNNEKVNLINLLEQQWTLQ